MTQAPSRPRRRIETRVPELSGGSPTRTPGRKPPSLLHHLAPEVHSSTGQEGAVSGEERYRVEGEIGAGGMGKVLRVADTDLNREIAMKVLINASNQSTMRRFIEEAQITSQLEHPNMLPVHDFGINEEGDVFFTMQYVRSHDTLGELIERLREGDEATHRHYTFERRVQLIQQVCNALDYAHERGVIHRDIKPDNVMVGEYGQVYLVDWGVAKLLDQAEREVPHTLRNTDEPGPDATRDGILIGTPPYMAPEQILGLNDEVDQITDVYALCVVLYELLTLNYYLGAVADDLPAITSAVVHRRPPDAESHLGARNGRVPRSLSRICRKGLAKPREKRFQSARELASALQDWIEGNAPVVCPGTMIQRSLAGYSRAIDRRPVLLPALTITLLILVTGWLILATVLIAFP